MDPRLAITICNALAHLAVLWRLGSARLFRKYPWFTLMVATTVLQSFGWTLGPPESPAYRDFWLYTTPLLIGLRVLTVVELWRLLLSRCIHVRALHSILLPTIVVIAVSTSVASGVDLWGFANAVRGLSLAVRFSASILAVITVLLVLFARIFSEPLPRNTVRHALILCGFFTSLAIGHLVLHITADYAELVGAVMVGTGAAFCGLWAVLITPAGETKREWVPATDNQIDGLDSRDDIRALAASLMKAQDEERRRISRDLHDHICHQLAFVAIDVGKLAVGPLPLENARARLEAIQARVVKTSQEAHQIAYHMRISILDDLGLVASLKDLCSHFTEQYPDVTVDFEDNGVPGSMQSELACCFYRVAEESLQNIAKHSGAKNVSVRIGFKKGAVVLTIQDDGVGMDPQAVKSKGRLGLISMEERARSVEGKLKITAQLGHGTQVALEVPVQAGNR